MPRRCALVLPPLILAAWAYAPILHSPFFTDDFVQLYRVRVVPFGAFLFTPYGGHLLVAQNAILAAGHVLFGALPGPLFAAMLALHLLAVAVLFAAVRRLTASAALACATAAWWGTLPVLNGTLRWYSVLGQVIAAIAVLAILASVTPRPGPARRAAWFALALLAALSFGEGIGVAMAMPFALWVLIGARRPPCLALLAIVPIVYALAYLAFGDQSGFELADVRRAMLELHPGVDPPTLPAMLVSGARLFVGLLSFGIASLLRVRWWLATLACGVGVAWLLRSAPRPALALLLLLSAAYGIVAVGRAALIPPVPLEHLSDAPRYHYLPTALLAVLAALAIEPMARRVPVAVGRVVLPLWLIVVAWCLVPSIDEHAAAQAALNDALAAMRAQIAATPAGQTVYIENRPFAAMANFTRPAVFPGWAALHVIFGDDQGRHVMFVEPRDWRTSGLEPTTSGTDFTDDISDRTDEKGKEN